MRDFSIHVDLVYVLAGAHKFRHERSTCQDKEHIGIFGKITQNVRVISPFRCGPRRYRTGFNDPVVELPFFDERSIRGNVRATDGFTSVRTYNANRKAGEMANWDFWPNLAACESRNLGKRSSNYAVR